jgi:hypothetical protein
MVKMTVAMCVLAATFAIGSPAASTNYVESVPALDVGYYTALSWPTPKTSYVSIRGLSGNYELDPITLAPGDTLTVYITFNPQLPYPVELGETFLERGAYQYFPVLTPERETIGLVDNKLEGGVITDSFGYITSVTDYFQAETLAEGHALTADVPLAGEFSFTFGPDVPEPTSWSLAILGIGITGAALRFRRRVNWA